MVGLSFLALLSACGGGNDNTPPNPPSSIDKWTWVSGSNTTFQAGTYGTLGTGSTSNIPGARAWAGSWIDSSGKLWIFGGEGEDSAGSIGFLNDLWRYNPTSLEWTWISGSNVMNQAGIYGTLGAADPANVPGARSLFITWRDSAGALWLFGGWGYDSAGDLEHNNDLWKFDGTNWTWVSGSMTVDQAGNYGMLGSPSVLNVPGARSAGVSWVDSAGKLWLFGGVGLDSTGDAGALNDLWRFDPATLEWTWVSGSDLVGQDGTYGAKGTGSTSNVPGARYGSASWIDSSGNLWLFGGLGLDSAGSNDYLNDLWKFNPTTLEWTWVSGSKTVDQVGTYGTKGTPASSNIPGARTGAVSWIDSSGGLWLFGGGGLDSASNAGDLNDLWRYDGTAWKWVSGSSSVSQEGTYGTKGTAASSNVPGAREYALAWIDSSGDLWLFGGFGLTSSNYQELFNDLWRYDR
jgi:N-acetylneuraminic acid mutarotase